MLSLVKNSGNFLILLVSVVAIILGFWHYQSLDSVVTILLSICAVLLLILAVFLHPYYFYIGLIAFIPLSIDITIFGDAKLSGPSEAMLLMLLPVLFLFHDDFRKSIRKISVHPITILLAIDLVIQVVTTLTSSHIDVSMKRLFIKLLFILGFYLTAASLNNAKKLIHVWAAYAIGLLPVMYFTFMNHVHFNFDPKTVFAISKPFYTDHTLYGACLAFIIPVLVLLVFNLKKLNWTPFQKGMIISTLLICVAAEAFALSRAAILSSFVALLYYLLLHLKVRFPAIIMGLLVIVVSVFAMKDTIYATLEKNEAVSNDGELSNHFSSVTNIQTDASNLERVNRWICAIRMFEDRPWFGFGPGTYQFEYNKYQTVVNKTYISTNAGDRGNAHSEYLTYLSENGIFGAIIFLLTVFGAIYYGMQNNELISDPMLKIINLGVLLGLITYFFHGVFNSFIDQSKMSFLYYTALSTIVIINLTLRKNNSLNA